MTQISPQLNVVIPVDRPQDTVYVHCAPLRQEVFERYYLPIAQTFSAINGGGLGMLSGPRVAALVLRDKAKEAGMWDGPDGAEAGLMEELRRSANVLARGDKGWAPVPLKVAEQQGWVTSEDVSEVENALVYFIVASAMHRKNVREAVVEGAMKLWDAQVTSSDCTAFAASLPMLTEAESSGAKVTASSVPG